MSTPVSRIKSMIDALPKKDIPFGFKFLEKRDFDSLKELVDSAIYKINKNLLSSNPKEEYINIDLERLNTLKSEIDSYILQIDIEDYDNNDDFYNFNEDLY